MRWDQSRRGSKRASRPANLEDPNSLERLKQRVLDEIVGIGCVARLLRQSARGPAPERRQVSDHETVERLLVARASALNQAEGRFKIGPSHRGRVERIAARAGIGHMQLG